MNKKVISTIILIILTIGVFYYLIKDNYQDIFNSIIHANILFLFVALLLYVIYTVLQAIPFYNFSKMHNYKVSFPFYIYLIVATNFFNGITPLATGGQPLQVYAMHKKNISTVDASNIVIENFILFQFSAVLFGLISLIINSIFHLFNVNPILNNLTIIGFILNFFLLIFVIAVSFNKTFIQNVINFFLNIFYKIKLIKDIQKSKDKWKNTCNEFYENFQILLKNKNILFKNVLILLIAFFFYYSIPLAIIYALGIESNINLVITIIISSYVFLASSYLPVPGATGGMEYAFLGYFSNYIIGYKLNSLLIIWRFITYYLPLIVGGIVFNINSIKNKK